GRHPRCDHPAQRHEAGAVRELQPAEHRRPALALSHPRLPPARRLRLARLGRQPGQAIRPLLRGRSGRHRPAAALQLALRRPPAIALPLLHGDSDKLVSVSNQVTAYDYSFVAGQAAIDRLERYTSLFAAPSRCIPIGRPARDTDRMPVASRTDDCTTVLYAPTWEGGQASAGYSSLRTHAAAAVRSLAEAGLRVIYRPHP